MTLKTFFLTTKKCNLSLSRSEAKFNLLTASRFSVVSGFDSLVHFLSFSNSHSIIAKVVVVIWRVCYPHGCHRSYCGACTLLTAFMMEVCARVTRLLQTWSIARWYRIFDRVWRELGLYEQVYNFSRFFRRLLLAETALVLGRTIVSVCSKYCPTRFCQW